MIFIRKPFMASGLTTNWNMLALNKKRNQAGRWPEGHSNSKRLTVCSPPLINEGNYLGWESARTRAAASPGGTLLLNLLRPPQKHTAPSLPLNLTHQYPVQLICKFGNGANLKDWMWWYRMWWSSVCQLPYISAVKAQKNNIWTVPNLYRIPLMLYYHYL